MYQKRYVLWFVKQFYFTLTNEFKKLYYQQAKKNLSKKGIQPKTKHKRKNVQQRKQTKKKKINEQHYIIEDEDEGAEYLVDAILGFKSAGKKATSYQ